MPSRPCAGSGRKAGGGGESSNTGIARPFRLPRLAKDVSTRGSMGDPEAELPLELEVDTSDLGLVTVVGVVGGVRMIASWASRLNDSVSLVISSRQCSTDFRAASLRSFVVIPLMTVS